MNVTVAQFYRAYKGLYLAVAAIPLATPIARAFLNSQTAVTDYLYPPLGDVEPLARALTVALLFLATIVVFICCKPARRIHPLAAASLWLGALVGSCVLIPMHIKFVKFVPVQSENTVVPVSIGYEPTQFAMQTYPSPNAWEMLHDQGPWESKIQELWTLHSIIVVRIGLWLTYTLTLALLTSAVSLAAYQHAAETLEGRPGTRSPKGHRPISGLSGRTTVASKTYSRRARIS